MRWKTVILISALALIAAACGGGESTDVDNGAVTTVGGGNSGTADPQTAEPPPDEPAAPSQSASGEFTVNGETFQIEEIRRCEPFDFYDENHPDNLDVAARSGGIYINATISGSTGLAPAENGVEEYNQQTHSLQLSVSTESGPEQYESSASHGIDNVWFVGFVPVPGADQEGEMLDGAPFTVSGNTISGSMTLAKDFPDTNGSADVSFQFDFPNDIVEC